MSPKSDGLTLIIPNGSEPTLAGIDYSERLFAKSNPASLADKISSKRASCVMAYAPNLHEKGVRCDRRSDTIRVFTVLGTMFVIKLQAWAHRVRQWKTLCIYLYIYIRAHASGFLINEEYVFHWGILHVVMTQTHDAYAANSAYKVSPSGHNTDHGLIILAEQKRRPIR